MFAKRVQTLETSPTIAIDVKAKDFKRQGISVINLSVGEPNFPTPENIKKAAHKAIDENVSYYTDPGGMVELREVISKKLKNDNNVSYDPSEIIVGAGSKQLLYIAFQVLCDKGNEVIIPVPTWSTFGEQVKLADGRPVFIKLQSPFKLTANDVAKGLTHKTKILLLNSPSNPTGAMIDPKELKKIAELAVKHNFFVIADEIYEKLIYTEKHLSIASLNKDIKQRTILINGVSKSYAMTGWRVGYAASSKEIIAKMKALQSQLLTNTSTISQMAAGEALKGNQTSVTKMRDAFARRRDFCIKALSKINKLSFAEPEGAFYLFINIEKLLGEKYSSAAIWAEALLEKEKVAVVPGEAFYYPGYVRLSFAASDEDLKEAIKRIERFIKE